MSKDIAAEDAAFWLTRPEKNNFGLNTERYAANWTLPPELESKVTDLAEAFAEARLSETFEACPHCFTDADIAYVRDVPPLQMTNCDIAIIAFKLISTIGSVDDVAYFLPAMVRAVFCGVPLEESLVFKKMQMIPAGGWTATRAAALRAAFNSWFALRPEYYRDADGVDELIAWTREILNRPEHTEAVVRPVPGWD